MNRLAVRVGPADAEIVLAQLLELAPAGVEEVQLPGGLVEYAVYGSPGELPALGDVRAAAGPALVEVSTSEVPDDWSERWKRFHGATSIESPAPGTVPSLCVRPPWIGPRARADTIDIMIDPGQAFGTGAHATTRLCLGLLLELAAREAGPAKGPLVDVGSGSGVLAIAASKLGYSPVIACDHDRASVAATAENARANHVVIDARRLDIRREPIPLVGSAQGPADEGKTAGARPAIVANLVRPLLMDLAASIGRAPAHLIAGGLLTGEMDEVAQVYSRRLGMRERGRRADGEWAALWLEASRPPGTGSIQYG